MPVFVTRGDLFKAGAECVVNPVNTVGVMGAGLAKQFASRWPEMLFAYKLACRDGGCAIGQVHLWSTGSTRPTWVANLPTKVQWRDPSQLNYVSSGLMSLAALIEANHIGTVAVPALGCGLGGLAWADVEALTKNILGGTSARVLLYPPG